MCPPLGQYNMSSCHFATASSHTSSLASLPTSKDKASQRSAYPFLPGTACSFPGHEISQWPLITSSLLLGLTRKNAHSQLHPYTLSSLELQDWVECRSDQLLEGGTCPVKPLHLLAPVSRIRDAIWTASFRPRPNS